MTVRPWEDGLLVALVALVVIWLAVWAWRLWRDRA
jgi:hypothetical protein